VNELTKRMVAFVVVFSRRLSIENLTTLISFEEISSSIHIDMTVMLPMIEAKS
jgi:hypothetical protein